MVGTVGIVDHDLIPSLGDEAECLWCGRRAPIPEDRPGEPSYPCPHCGTSVMSMANNGTDLRDIATWATNNGLRLRVRLVPLEEYDFSDGEVGKYAERAKITKTPGVCGGRACIGGTRIPVWVVAAYVDMGKSDDELLMMWEPISRKQLANAKRYIEANPDEIQKDIAENRDGD